MQEWLQRPDFSATLPDLLEGEDPEFTAYITKLAQTKVGGEHDPIRPFAHAA